MRVEWVRVVVRGCVDEDGVWYGDVEVKLRWGGWLVLVGLVALVVLT